MYFKCMEMRMGFFRFLFLLLAIVAVFSMSVGASGFEISGVGTKAMGMGGAYRAIADDWTAAYYNPAGYAKIFDSQYGISNGFFQYRYELTPNYLWDGTYETGLFNDQVNYNDHEILSNPSGGFATRLPAFGEIGVGLSVFQLFDQNNSWNIYDLPHTYNDVLVLPHDQFAVNLDVVAFQLTVAKQFMDDKLSLGLGLQLLRADLLYSNVYFRDNPFYSPDNTNPVAVRPYDKITQWNKNDGNGYGFGINVGLLYDFSEKLHLGLNARVPFAITLTGNADLQYYMPIVSGIDSAGVDDPNSPVSVGNLFIAGNKVASTADFETELKLPTAYGFGIAYQFSEKLLVSFDAEYTLWSNYEGLSFDYSGSFSGFPLAITDSSELVTDFLTADLSNLVDWENTGKVSLGLAYDLNQYITLLGGGSADQSPARLNNLLTPQFFDTGDKYTYSGGLIWHYNQYDFGFVTTYTTYPDLNSAKLVDADSDGLFDNINGLYTAEAFETVFSFIYRF